MMDDVCSRFSRFSRCYLVQGAHGEHGAVVCFDGLDERGVPPDVDVSVGGSGEHQVLRPAVTRRHHRLLLPQVPEDPPFEGETAPCRTRAGPGQVRSYLYIMVQITTEGI